MDKIFEAIANNIIVFGAFLVPIGIVAVTSYFSHRRLELVHQERMAAIAKGMAPPPDLPDPHKEDQEREAKAPKAPPDYLRTGLFWLCPGGAVVAFCLIAMQDLNAAIRLPILGVAVICAGIGAAYVAMHVVEQDRKRGGLQ